MRIGLAALMAATCLAGSAAAEPIEIGQVAQGAIYYNRPGASLADHDAELADCLRITVPPEPQMQRYALITKGGRTTDMTWINHLIWDGPIAGLRAVTAENCMLVRGWRAVRIPESERPELAGLSGDELAHRLEPWIGAETPHGEIVRAFRNEAFHPGAYHTASRPERPARDHLSLRLYGRTNPDKPEPPLPQPFTMDPQWPTKALPLDQLSAAPPGSGLIVVRVAGIGATHGNGVVFQREGKDPMRLARFDDHLPDILAAATGMLGGKRDGNWFILAAAPGRWRILASNFLNYCLGSPSFELKAGEVVYAGTLHIDGPNYGPDLDLSPARAYLPAPFAERVRAATYRNGSRSDCRGYIVSYALEFPDTPYAPDYTWGDARPASQPDKASAAPAAP